MASIYKRKQDLQKKRSPWYIGYTSEIGKRCTVKGFSDKGETERLAAKLEHEVMLRKRGLIDPEQERLAQRRKTPVVQHLAAFEKSLAKNTPKHVKLTMARVRRVVNGIGANSVGDLTSEAVEEFMQELVEKEKIGNRTYNHYVQATDEFCRWMVLSKRASVNPLLGLKRLNTEVDVRHRRRSLTSEEIMKLVESARQSNQTIQCFDGETRARIYILAYMTGLRRNELASLTSKSFDLKSKQPTITVEAAFSKHRRRDVLPLHPELVTMLRSWLEDYRPDELLFPKLGKRRTWYMVKKDLERVGIEYETREGIADFHAAGRHSHITELLRSGVSLPEAKELARHSDIKMTMRYTHIGMEDQAKAIKQLPWQSPKTPKTESTRSGSDWTSAQHSGSEPGVSGCHNTTLSDTGKSSPSNDATRAGGTGCREFSSSDSECQKWRRRESNPARISTQPLTALAIAKRVRSAALQMRCI